MVIFGFFADIKDMEEVEDFNQQLQTALVKKQEWFNNELLQQCIGNYRLLHTIVKNLFDLLVKKSLITPDPYRLDKRISDIVLPESTPFPESDISKELGLRFSDYELMLDFICTYFRFSVDNLSIVKIKKLFDFNASFDWEELTANSSKVNTKALALIIGNARNSSQPVMISMLNDSISKCGNVIQKINSQLTELAAFQKEMYKGEIRKNVFDNPGFNKDVLSKGADAEFAEIKRLFPKTMGKRPFYNDLISEIIQEDSGNDKEKRRAAVLKSLEIVQSVSDKPKEKKGPDTKALLMEAVFAVGGLAPTIQALRSKLEEDFKILFAKKKSIFGSIIDAFKKAFKIKPKEQICEITIRDPKTDAERKDKVVVNEFMDSLAAKERIYTGISNRGPEFSKIFNASEESIVNFVTKQLSEAKSLFTTINALDIHFKKEVEIINRPKVKGLQIELSALRNSVVAINKKRGEYLSLKEENEQMKKLGISENEA